VDISNALRKICFFPLIRAGPVISVCSVVVCCRFAGGDESAFVLRLFVPAMIHKMSSYRIEDFAKWLLESCLVLSSPIPMITHVKDSKLPDMRIARN
jgi:hypothetical protein